MNEERSFERFVADNVAGERGGTPLPDDFYDDMHSFANRTRQRPEWLALIKEPPMRTNSHLSVGSPTMRVAAILAATLLLAVSLAVAGLAGQQLLAADGPIVVDADGRGDYFTIQEAVAVADDGDEILVMSGTYQGPVDISADITLRGEDRDGVVVEFGAGCVPADEDDFMMPEICPEGTRLYDGFWFGDSSYGFLLDESDAQLSDLTIRQSPTTEGVAVVVNGEAPAISRITTAGDGTLYVHGGSAARISDSDLGDGWVFFEERSPASIESSSFGAIVANTSNTSMTGGPATIRDNRTTGIAFNGSAEVVGNTLIAPEGGPIEDDFYGQGIDVQWGDGWTIADNVVEGFRDATAIMTAFGARGTIAGNTVTDNRLGMGLGNADHIVSENVVSGGDAGILVLGGQAELTENRIEGVSGRGLAIEGTARPTLSGNRSCGNGENLWVADNAEPVIDETNEICEDVAAE